MKKIIILIVFFCSSLTLSSKGQTIQYTNDDCNELVIAVNSKTKSSGSRYNNNMKLWGEEVIIPSMANSLLNIEKKYDFAFSETQIKNLLDIMIPCFTNALYKDEDNTRINALFFSMLLSIISNKSNNSYSSSGSFSSNNNSKTNSNSKSVNKCPECCKLPNNQNL